MKLIVNQIKEHKAKIIEAHMPSKSGPKLTDSKQDIVDFKAKFDQLYMDEMDTSRFIEADGFHPSALGTYSGKCIRNQVYMLRGVEKKNTFDARTLRVLDTGNHIHEKLQSAFERMGVLVSAEIPIEYAYPPIKGHTDGVIKFNDQIILIEIKSCNSNTFEMRKKWKKPKPEHFDQANIYAYILELEKVWIIYYCKDNEELEIFELDADPKAAERIIKKWTKTYETFKAGDLPKRPYKRDSKECMYCPLADTCWSDNEDSV